MKGFRCRIAAGMLGVVLFTLSPVWAGPSRVLLVVLDGLGAAAVEEGTMPHLARLARERSVYHREGHAVMPSVTNTNHVSLATGTYPGAHGIVGNFYWDRSRPRGRGYLRQSEQIEVETIFTLLGERPSAGIFGKAKLGQIFSGDGAQKEPASLWTDPDLADDLEGASRLDSARRVIDETLRVLVEEQPVFVFAAVPDVDLVSHHAGPDGDAAHETLRRVDAEMGRLVRELEAHDLWKDMVLVVTSDHGFASVEPSGTRPYPRIHFGRELLRRNIEDAFVVSNGGIAFVYLEDGPELDEAGRKRLELVRSLALEQPEIASAHTPVPKDGEEPLLAEGWRNVHPRVGDLVLVARPGYLFNDPFSVRAAGLRGSHGGPDTREVPFLLTGGWEGLRRGASLRSTPTNADLGRTVLRLLGLRDPRYVDGRPVPARLLGRVLDEAFVRPLVSMDE